MNYNTLIFALLIATTFPWQTKTAHAASEAANNSSIHPKFCQIQGIEKDLQFLTAQIKTQHDLNQHILSSGNKKSNSPLNYLSRSGQKNFVSSITFNEKGITGYRYDILEKELTLSQIYEILALFGQQHNIEYMEAAKVETDFDMEIKNLIQSRREYNANIKCGSSDHKGYQCTARATCSSSYTRICMSSC